LGIVDIGVDGYNAVNMDYQRDEHRVHLIVYHLIWCSKRRKPILAGAVAADCRKLIEGKCQERGWTILELAIQPDHVHLFVRAWPTDSPAEIVKECKGVTSSRLRQKFKHLLKLPSLWTRSYFAGVQRPTAGVIEAFIRAQPKV
jgi:putative transposase